MMAAASGVLQVSDQQRRPRVSDPGGPAQLQHVADRGRDHRHRSARVRALEIAATGGRAKAGPGGSPAGEREGGTGRLG